jgi:cytochrome c oxidase subunit IV
MDNQVEGFGKVAAGLARNPLGIIALFIVLVYGFACLVTAFAGSFSEVERLPLIYFLVTFPILVLCIFSWLVSRHSGTQLSPHFFERQNATGGWRFAATILA